MVADFFSCNPVPPGEWSLNPEVFRGLTTRLGFPDVAVFTKTKREGVQTG